MKSHTTNETTMKYITRKTTGEYFNLTTDELLELGDGKGFTKEECLLFDDGAEVVFFDDENELKSEQQEFNDYIKLKKYEIKATLKTINERIAVVLI